MSKVLLEKVMWEHEGQRERIIIEETFRAEFLEITSMLEDVATGHSLETTSMSLHKNDAVALAKWIVENIETGG